MAVTPLPPSYLPPKTRGDLFQEMKTIATYVVEGSVLALEHAKRPDLSPDASCIKMADSAAKLESAKRMVKSLSSLDDPAKMTIGRVVLSPELSVAPPKQTIRPGLTQGLGAR